MRHGQFDAAGQSGFDEFESSDSQERIDVMLRCQDIDLMKWKGMGWLAKIDDLPNWKLRPKHLEDDNRYVYFIGSPHVIAYNPEKIQESELPKTYEELLDSKWKDKLVMRNPLAGNSPAFFVQFIKQKHGGLDWFKKFGANAPFIAASGVMVHESIQKGPRSVALSRDLEVITFNARTKGTKLKYYYMENDLPYQYQLALMNSKAPHKASAKLFLNWLLSAEAREVMEKNGFSVGDRQATALKKQTTFQWQMTKGGQDYNHNRSMLFEAQRNLKSGGASMAEKPQMFREQNSVADHPHFD
jgi:iron(III) transport system substrate-binding protein